MLTALLVAVGSQVPAELREALQLLAFREALVEFDVLYEEADTVGRIRNRFDGPRFQYARGIPVARDLEVPNLAPLERVVTKLDEGFFVGNGRAIGVEWHDHYQEDRTLSDLRNLGMSASDTGLLRRFDDVWVDPGEAHCGEEPVYRVNYTETGVVVAAQCASGYSLEWVIRDGERPLIVSITARRDELVTYRAELRWTEHDGTPVPETVQYLEDRSGSLAPVTRLTLRTARFQNLGKMTPEDADIDIGTNIDRYVKGEEEMWPGTDISKTYTWDGANFITFKEMMRRKDAGELQLGERFRCDFALVILNRELSAGVAGTSGWRGFVSDFIRVYKLDVEQAQKAWSIHDHCLQEYRAFCDRKSRSGSPSALTERIARDVSDLAAHTQLGVKEIAAERAAATRPLAEYAAAAREIFKDRLVPRVYTLPTRNQLRTADDRQLRAVFEEFLPAETKGAD